MRRRRRHDAAWGSRHRRYRRAAGGSKRCVWPRCACCDGRPSAGLQHLREGSSSVAFQPARLLRPRPLRGRRLAPDRLRCLRASGRLLPRFNRRASREMCSTRWPSIVRASGLMTAGQTALGLEKARENVASLGSRPDRSSRTSRKACRQPQDVDQACASRNVEHGRRSARQRRAVLLLRPRRGSRAEEPRPAPVPAATNSSCARPSGQPLSSLGNNSCCQAYQ